MLTEKDEEEIRRLYREDPKRWPPKRLGPRFKCSRQTIRRVLSNRKKFPSEVPPQPRSTPDELSGVAWVEDEALKRTRNRAARERALVERRDCALFLVSEIEQHGLGNLSFGGPAAVWQYYMLERLISSTAADFGAQVENRDFDPLLLFLPAFREFINRRYKARVLGLPTWEEFLADYRTHGVGR